ncbi:MAG: 3-deoxy-7-phosphoheptulonate synthase class II [Actinomycetaceae bacterium]|nr:3-deoxy-7-phosphoheptulonate synthase class II [Arcanobacterium sp.]MDD7686360.1 3-deoxy-7-phosphoheptulonate synthase class II [Actinomycetaceae bacterium]MDY5274219.1 3-deoxy-7-phosphoheptulonate synthase class II [Arcanobacterium sp.]
MENDGNLARTAAQTASGTARPAAQTPSPTASSTGAAAFHEHSTQTAALDAALGAWRDYPAQHQPAYPDSAALTAAVNYLRTLPPLVFAGEADSLKSKLAAAGEGKAFVLQGGDCAESFADSTAERIRAKIRTILQMSVVLSYGASVPVIRIGRMAGQFAKPRSKATETRYGVELPSYMGDAVNHHDFTPSARTPDPRRLVEAYQHSAATLNLIRAFTMGGFADLSKVHEWNLGFSSNPAYKRYNQLAGEIDKAMRFLKAAGVQEASLEKADFYSSHEALLLDYEYAMTRIDSRTNLPYNTGAHFVWIGERTRDPNGAHVQMLAHVQNPIGVKLGPTTEPDDVLRLMDQLNPNGEPGRLSLIVRMGAANVREKLPKLLHAVAVDGRPVTWMSDPMHGNTITAANGYKTRRMNDILAEIQGFFGACQAEGVHPGGLHIELTGDDVTEVLGGAEEIDEATLSQRYESLVDPRLNHQQSLEMAFLVAEMLKDATL